MHQLPIWYYLQAFFRNYATKSEIKFYSQLPYRIREQDFDILIDLCALIKFRFSKKALISKSKLRQILWSV